MNARRSTALALVGLLALAHQDSWLWDDATLWFGVLPAGLGWHAGVSVAAALCWAGVTVFAWPEPPEGEEAP